MLNVFPWIRDSLWAGADDLTFKKRGRGGEEWTVYSFTGLLGITFIIICGMDSRKTQTGTGPHFGTLLQIHVHFTLSIMQNRAYVNPVCIIIFPHHIFQQLYYKLFIN